MNEVKMHGPSYSDASTYSNTDSSRVKSLDGPDAANQIVVPDDSYGYTCDITGQLTGVIVGVIKKDHLFTICGKEDKTVLAEDEANFFEIFNILNNNITNQFGDFMETKIDRSPPRYFDAEKDSKFDGKKFIEAHYEIKLAENTYPLDFYFWY